MLVLPLQPIEATWRIYVSLINPSLIQIMARRLFGPNLLFTSLLVRCQLPHSGQTLRNFNWKFNYCYPWDNKVWKSRLAMADILYWYQWVSVVVWLYMQHLRPVSLVTLWIMQVCSSTMVLPYSGISTFPKYCCIYRNFVGQLVNWTFPSNNEFKHISGQIH